MHRPYSTLGYEGYDPDADETGMKGITLAEEIIKKRGFPGEDLVTFVSPGIRRLENLEAAARVVFSPISKRRGRKATLGELREQVNQLGNLGVPIREDYLSLKRPALLRYAVGLQRKIIRSADRYCPEVRREFDKPYSALDDL